MAKGVLEERRQERFARLADQVALTVENRTEAYVALLRGAAALFAASDDVTGEEFADYVARIDLTERYPGVQGLGFARVAREGRVELAPGVSPWPDPASAASAIVFLQPEDRRNRVALGFDMYGEPVRRAAMDRARDSGSVAATGPVTLVQEVDAAKQPGFLIYAPVYRAGRSPASADERRDQHVGWVYSPFRTHDLFRWTFARSTALDEVDVQIYDGTVLLFSSRATPEAAAVQARPVRVADRTWTLRVRPAPGTPVHAWGPALLVFFGGLGVTAALWLAAFVQRERLRQARRAAEEAREAVRRTELLLQEVNHRVANSLQLVASMVTLQGEAAPPAARAALADTRSRIMAVARVHQRLYTSGDVRQVDLRAYLEKLVQEVAESLNGDASRLELEAVDATVPTDKAVSVGVAVAELISNAVKYAYPDDRMGPIRVRLTRPDPGRLELAVEDEGVGYTPVPGKAKGTGLGMKIVRAMASNLQAEVTVTPSLPGTRVALAFPLAA